jgi:hypothetical protein
MQILRFWTLSMALFLSKNNDLFIFQNITFRRYDFVSVFRQNLLSRAQSIQLAPILFSSCVSILPWSWRRHVHPEIQVACKLHCTLKQMAVFFRFGHENLKYKKLKFNISLSKGGTRVQHPYCIVCSSLQRLWLPYILFRVRNKFHMILWRTA